MTLHPELPVADVLHRLELLYRRINGRAADLTEMHRSRLVCKNGCCDCCEDEITVYTIEAANIVARYKDLCDKEPAAAVGRCAFLDGNGSCRIYPARPYVCRTQGLPLQWMDEREDGSCVAYRDICAKNEEGPPIEELTEDACWIIGPVEEELVRLQLEFSNGSAERISLRALFAHDGRE